LAHDGSWCLVEILLFLFLGRLERFFYPNKKEKKEYKKLLFAVFFPYMGNYDIKESNM